MPAACSSWCQGIAF